MFPLNKYCSPASNSWKSPHRACSRELAKRSRGGRSSLSVQFYPFFLTHAWMCFVSLVFSLLVLKNAEMGPNETYNSSDSTFPWTVSSHCFCEEQFPNRKDLYSLLLKERQYIFSLCWLEKVKVSLEVKHTYTIWSSNPLLDIYPREKEIYVFTKSCTQISMAALFISPNWKQPKCLSIVKRIKWTVI